MQKGWRLLGLILVGLFLFSLPGSACKGAEVSYSNSTYGFSLSFPKGWVEEETGGHFPIVSIRAPSDLPLVNVSLNYLPQDQTLAEFVSSFKESLGQSLAQFQVISEGEVALKKKARGQELVFTWASGERKLKGKSLFLLRGVQVFEVDALSTETNFDRLQDTINEIVYSFRLEEVKPFGIPREEALFLFDLGPITLDPALVRETRSLSYVLQIFSGLLAFDKDMNLVPDIAKTWEVSGDGRTYTFHLRRGAKFHNGKEVTAQDFKYSLERAAHPATGSQTALTYLGDIVGVREKLEGTAKEIEGVQVLDNYTLRLTIDAPKAYFLAKLTYPTAFVVDRENVEEGQEWWSRPNGTGPFKLKEWQRDELLLLERNDSFYKEKAGVKHVIFRLWGGVPMRMYETGEIDIASVSLEDLERVLDPTNPLSRELLTGPQFSLFYVGFDASRPPFNEAQVRRAFSQAIDKDKIVKVVLKGAARRADGILPPGMPGYNERLQGLPFDVAAARRAIEESSYGAVSNLPPITLTTPAYGEDPGPLVKALLAMWRENLGVEVELSLLDPETYDYVLMEEKGELFASGWSADYPDPQNFLDILFRSGSENNLGEYSHPELDTLLERASGERIEALRLSLYQGAEEIIVADAAILPLSFGVEYVLVKPYVKGYAVNPLGLPLLKEVSLEPR